MPLRYQHLVKQWVPSDLPKVNTDFCVNERIYRIVPSSLHRLGFVDVYVTSECILLCILCIVTRCLIRDVSIMYLSHVIMSRCFDRED